MLTDFRANGVYWSQKITSVFYTSTWEWKNNPLRPRANFPKLNSPNISGNSVTAREKNGFRYNFLSSTFCFAHLPKLGALEVHCVYIERQNFHDSSQLLVSIRFQSLGLGPQCLLFLLGSHCKDWYNSATYGTKHIPSFPYRSAKTTNRALWTKAQGLSAMIIRLLARASKINPNPNFWLAKDDNFNNH